MVKQDIISNGLRMVKRKANMLMILLLLIYVPRLKEEENFKREKKNLFCCYQRQKR